MKNKKRIIIIFLAVVLLLVAVFGGIEIYKYNTMVFRIGIAKGRDGRLEQPVLTYGANSSFGASQKATKRGDAMMKEWHDKVGSMILDITTTYGEDKEHTVKVEYNVVDGKTEVRMYGEGIPNGGTEKQVIDERVLLDHLYELDKDVVY